MPNTPGQIGAGITAWCARAAPTAADRTAIEGILGSLGVVLELPETHLDAVTAVSGSGPAYLFEFAAAFRAAAVASGLPPATAEKLAFETIRGAAKLLETSGEDPEKLRDAVTSPGGTTEAALKVFQAGQFSPGFCGRRRRRETTLGRTGEAVGFMISDFMIYEIKSRTQHSLFLNLKSRILLLKS